MKYHYVYRITEIIKRKHYYGVRTSKVEPLNDLGIKYFSSSRDKEFIKDQKENPQNYRYKIIMVFTARKDAIKLEIKLHNKFNVGVNESFYNRSKQTSVGWDTTGISFPKSDETKLKLSEANKGKKHSETTKLKISNKSKINAKKQWENYSDIQRKEICNKIKKSNKRYFESLTIEQKQEYSKKLHEWKKENPDKLKDNWKRAAKKRTGKNNGSAKQINIYDSDGNLMFECYGNFGNICTEHGIPHGKLKESLRDGGSPIYQSKYGQTMAKKNGTDKFIGWYAKYKERK